MNSTEALNNWLLENEEEYLRELVSASLLECVVLSAFSYNFILTIADEVQSWQHTPIISTYCQVLTIADEVEYVWTRQWTMGSSIYLLVLLYYLSASSASDLIHLNPGKISPLALHHLRTYAVYESKKALLWAFVILDFFALAAFILLNVLLSSFIPILWIPLFIVEGTTFVLIARKYWKMYKESKATQNTQPALLEAVVRGNIVYFAIIAVLYAIGAALEAPFYGTLKPLVLWNFHYVASVAVSGIISTKLFIDLKGTFVRQLEEAHSGPTTSMSFQVAPRDQFRLTLTSEP
ncbi:hypothetical protein M0805_003552 [Coniferiporia weirii]|nr:hypothetical protein M0805_003552 [Coniferiporia weirii]